MTSFLAKDSILITNLEIIDSNDKPILTNLLRHMTRPLIDLLFDPEHWPNIEYFSNSEVGSSYSPKFDEMAWRVIHAQHIPYNILPELKG